MTRRAAFLVAIALGAVVAGAPLPALAQQPGKVFRIGILSLAGQTSTNALDAFRNDRWSKPLEGRNQSDAQHR